MMCGSFPYALRPPPTISKKPGILCCFTSIQLLLNRRFSSTMLPDMDFARD
jgi:hypothetical protein